MDFSLRFFYRVKWTPAQDLPTHPREFISKITAEQKMNFPLPYVEIKSLETSAGKSSCFVFNIKIIFAIVLIGLGALLFLY